MTTRDVTIEIKQGSDVSPVAKCVQVASQFTSKIYVCLLYTSDAADE